MGTCSKVNETWKIVQTEKKLSIITAIGNRNIACKGKQKRSGTKKCKLKRNMTTMLTLEKNVAKKWNFKKLDRYMA